MRTERTGRAASGRNAETREAASMLVDQKTRGGNDWAGRARMRTVRITARGGARARAAGGKSLEKKQSRTGVPGEMKSVVMRDPKGQKAQPTQRVGSQAKQSKIY